jgi:uncharacterized radical SAM protein YgiQ
MGNDFLPTSPGEASRRGWDSLDVVIVTGDAYVDHPSYGPAMIARVLEGAGFRVGIIAQPDMRDPGSFTSLGRPRLFFGVTGGNLDSMVANYTANRKPRSDDDYAPGGRPGLRPDRAVIAYTNMIRALFPGAPVVIGGIEASLRRLAHYDYWSDKVRRSVLPDSKADILVYGMGELQVLEIARRLASGDDPSGMDPIAGTVVMRKSLEQLSNIVMLPSFEEVANDKRRFGEAFMKAYAEADPVRGRTIAQRHGDRFVVQFPPARPLTTAELDGLYELPFSMRPHPGYAAAGGVPGFETVRFSVTSHRGCPGECSFCSLYMHQGRIVQSRSRRSILAEIRRMASRPDFKGTVTDVGGPTANLYGAACHRWPVKGACPGRKCIAKGRCPDLNTGYDETLKLWREALRITGVRHIFLGSGVRYDLLCEKSSDAYLKALCADHVSGRLKVAPEHCVDAVLELMNKPPFSAYRKFAGRFERMSRSLGKRQYLVNYLISAHPGSTLEDALSLALELNKLGIRPEQIQDYLPLPMTLSGCMYHTGLDPATGRAVYVARLPRERKLQRSLIQSHQPENKRYVIEALRKLGRMDLAGELLD